MIVTISDLQVIRKVWRPTMRSSDRKFIKSKVRKVKIMKVFYCLVGAQRRSKAARSGQSCGLLRGSGMSERSGDPRLQGRECSAVPDTLCYRDLPSASSSPVGGPVRLGY